MGILSRLSPQAARSAAESAKQEQEAAAEREQEAKAAGDAARADREAAERSVVKTARDLQAASEELTLQAKGRLSSLTQALEDTRAYAESQLDVVPTPATRLTCRRWLHASGAEHEVGGQLVTLCAEDVVAGKYLDISQQGGRLMSWLAENFAAAELHRQADAVECRAWLGLIERIRFLAGEAEVTR